MRRLVPLLPLLFAGGCLEEPPFRCQSDEVCFLEGFAGTCDLATSSCVYPSADCRGINSVEGYVNGKGLCVPAPTNNVGPSSTTASSSTTGDESSGTTATPTTASTTNDSADESSTTNMQVDDGSSSGSAGESSSGTATTGAQDCQESLDITGEGSVTATTVFNGFPATNSVDGLITTSWFSTGPEGDGGPSVYGWNAAADRCITRIEVDDNSAHSNPDFRTGYGFGSVVVRVVQGERVVFEETVQLPGTPDGPFAVDTGGVIGSRVLLELNAHENTECGGFSELRVFGG